MDTILLCSSYPPATTYIHNTFIENYMLAANGSYVKVYIYLSKCIQTGENNLSISSLADKMDNTEKDILRALNYWEKNNLIRLIKNGNSNEITGIEILNPGSMENISQTKDTNKTSIHAEQKEKTSRQKQDKAYTKDTIDSPGIHGNLEENFNNKEASNKETYKEESSIKEDIVTKEDIIINKTARLPQTNDTAATKETPDNVHHGKNTDIAITAAQTKRLAKDKEFIWTSRVIESYVNRPLNPGEIQLISYLYDNLGFSPELLLYLYEYCISLGKTTVNYIQAVALSWDKQNIKTPEDAKKASSSYNATYTAISKAFALGRPLAIIEKEFASRWLDEWHIDLAAVLEACGRTMLKLQKADFNYAEGILSNWHENNIHTLQDVSKADEVYAQNKSSTQGKKQQSFQTASYQDKNQFNRFQQREISEAEIDELEKQLLAN